jgi:hypothetical protein
VPCLSAQPVQFSVCRGEGLFERLDFGFEFGDVGPVAVR